MLPPPRPRTQESTGWATQQRGCWVTLNFTVVASVPAYAATVRCLMAKKRNKGGSVDKEARRSDELACKREHRIRV